MGVLANQRHELFAQALAKGLPASVAYVEAGYAENDSNSARLNGNEQVQLRVMELKQRAAARTEITVAGITERLLNIAAKGEASADAPMLSVARASLMDAAKLNGLVVEKSQLTGADGGPIKSSIEVVFVEPGEKGE